MRAEDRWPVTLDNPVWFHRAAWWVKAPQWRASLGDVGDLDTLLLGTQYLQAEGVRYALEANRRRQFQNSGSLPWQFNEPYPMAACSSAVDYFGHPKPLDHAVARAYAPVLVAASFPTQSWIDRERFEADLWCATSGTDSLDGHLYARLVGLDDTIYAEYDAPITIPANGTAAPHTFRALLNDLPDLFMLDLALVGAQMQPVAHNRYLFTRHADLNAALHQPTASLMVRVNKRLPTPDQWHITLHNPGTHAAMMIWLADARERGTSGWPHLSDNYFCLLPDETHALDVIWHGVPQAERALTLSGWNVAPVTI